MRVIATSGPGSAIVDRHRDQVASESPAEAASPSLTRAPVDLLAGLGILLLFGLSGFALDYFGVPYVRDGGSVLTKIHPATYTFALALAVAIVANPQPLAYAASLFMRRLGSVAVIAASAVIYIFVSRYKPTMSAAYLVDSLVSAALVALLLADTPERGRVRLARLLHMLVAANSLLAIIEVATRWRLFPFGVEGSYMTWDYRATALFGHPLDAALATGVYTVILMTTSRIPGLAPRLKLPVILLCMAAMPAIGARTSFAIVYLVAGLMCALAFIAFVRGRGVGYGHILVTLAGLAAVPLAALAAYQFGYLDGFLGRFENDSGSAQTRLQLYNLFSHYGFREMLTGYSPIEYQTRVRIEGLESGVENSWAGHLMQFGIPLSLLLWSALAAFLAELLRDAGRHAVLPTVFMLLVISTSVGISGKTPMLVMPVTIILVLLAHGDFGRPGRGGAPV